MIAANDKFRDFHNVTAWHNAGYYGEGISVGNGEGWSLSEYNPDGLCSSPTTISWTDDHGLATAKVLHEMAPKAKIIQLPFCSIEQSNLDFCLDYMKNNQVDLLTLSKSAVSQTENAARWLDYVDQVKDTAPLLMAIGNDSTSSYNTWCDRNETAIAIGAILLADDGTVTNANYSSVSDSIDFGACTNVYYYSGVRFTGTSCATPVLCGMMALVQEFFLKKTGKVLGFESLYRFMFDHSHDLSGDGLDSKEGHGYIILPNPEDINIARYATVEEGEEDMQITEFNDYHEMADWAKDSIQSMVDQGILSGDGVNFRPLEGMTRQEIACFGDRLVEYLIEALS